MSCSSSTDQTYSSEPKTIVFFGDSLTQGKGVQSEEAYPALIQEKLNEEGYSHIVVNAGRNGDTTQSGLSRLKTVLDQNEPDIFVLALGANDMIRKLSAPVTKKNLQVIINRVRDKYPDTQFVVVGVKFGLVLGMFTSKQYKTVYSDIAEANDALFIPNLLKGVVSKPDLNTSDNIHPNAKGQQKLAETVWKKLKSII